MLNPNRGRIVFWVIFAVVLIMLAATAASHPVQRPIGRAAHTFGGPETAYSSLYPYGGAGGGWSTTQYYQYMYDNYSDLYGDDGLFGIPPYISINRHRLPKPPPPDPATIEAYRLQQEMRNCGDSGRGVWSTQELRCIPWFGEGGVYPFDFSTYQTPDEYQPEPEPIIMGMEALEVDSQYQCVMSGNEWLAAGCQPLPNIWPRPNCPRIPPAKTEPELTRQRKACREISGCVFYEKDLCVEYF